MGNAYIYKNILDGVQNPKQKNYEYSQANDITVTPIRKTDILIKPSNSSFEPYVPESKVHTITFKYPRDITLQYNGMELAKSGRTGTVTSKITVPEEENGQPYIVAIQYSPKVRIGNLIDNYTNGYIVLGNFREDKSYVWSYVYKYEFKNTNGHITSVTIDDVTYTSFPFTYISLQPTITANFEIEDGFQIKSLVGTNAQSTATSNENEYTIKYSDRNTTTSSIDISTKVKEVEISYYNVLINGLNKSTVTYNSNILSELNGSAIIPNIASGTKVSLTITADEHYYIKKITYGTQVFEGITATEKTIEFTVTDSNLNVVVETALFQTKINFASNSYIQQIIFDSNVFVPSESKTILIYTEGNVDSKLVMEFRYNDTDYKLVSVSVSDGATITKHATVANRYVFTLTDSTVEEINVSYTVVPVSKYSVTLQNVENVTINKGSTTLNTATGAYSEQFTAGSSVIYTITPNEGYTLSDVIVSTSLSEYTYADGTLSISNIQDDIIVNIEATEITEPTVDRILLNFVNEENDVTIFKIGNTQNLVYSDVAALALKSTKIDEYYNTPQKLTADLNTGKTIVDITCTEGGTIIKDGTEYLFQLTSKSISEITITFVTADKTAVEETYTVTFNNADNAIVYYKNVQLDASIVDNITIYTWVGIKSGTTATFRIDLVDSDKYEFAFIPSVKPTSYTATWNATTQELTIPNIKSNVTVTLSIREKIPESLEESAKFYADNSKYTTSAYWTQTASGYKYSEALSGGLILGTTTAWWICFEYHSNSDYTIETTYTNISSIYMFRSASSLTAKSVGSNPTGKVTLNADVYKVDNGYKIPANTIGISSEYKYIYFAFVRDVASSVIPVITDVKYTEVLGTQSVFSASGNYTSELLSDFNMTMECDPLSQNIPYSEMSFKVYDEDNSFQLIDFDKEATGDINNDKFMRGAPFEVYTMTADATNKKMLTDNDYYIVQIGKFYLNNIIHDNDFATFSFIGIVEYYDNQYLNSAEKRLSSYYKPIIVREYIAQLFGNDAYVEDIPSYFRCVTPFENESKAEILRIICDYCNMFMTEGADGKIYFATRTTPNNPIEVVSSSGATMPLQITLDNSSNFVSFEQQYSKYDGANVEITKRIKNQPKKIYDISNFTLSVKNTETGESEDWQDDFGWRVCAKTDGTKNYYYDVDGREYIDDEDNVNAFKILESYGKIKYMKLSMDFPNPMTDFEFTASSLVVDSLPIVGNSFEDFLLMIKNRVLYPYEFGNINSCVQIFLSEKHLEFYLVFPIEKDDKGNNIVKYFLGDILNFHYFAYPTETFKEYIDNPKKEINYPDIVYDIWLTLDFCIQQSTAREITTSSRNYSYRPNKSAKNILDISNPLINSYSDAVYLSKVNVNKNNCATINATITDWDGNGLIELGNNILFEHSTGRNGVDKETASKTTREYDKFYCGIVKKNEYNFDGALSMDTTLSLGNDVYYKSDSSDDKTMIFPDTDKSKFIDGKIDF